MMALPTIVHLADDATAGGVMRVLDHILTAPELSEIAQHSLKCVDRNGMPLGHIEADMIVSHLAISWRSMPMLMLLRMRNPKTVLVHVEHSYTEAFVAENVTRKKRFAALLRLAYGIFNQVIAVSEAQGKWLRTSGAVKASSLSVIQSCVDLSAFRYLKHPSGPVRVIGAIGRLDRQKGFDTLIEAFKQTRDPNIALYVYGEGDEEEKLRALAEGDPRIQFQGFADPVIAIGSVDAVAMPSRWEAYGLVAIEALAAGRKLSVSKVDGLRDHIPFGAVGINGNSVSEWQREIERLTAVGTGNAIAAIPVQNFFMRRFADSWRGLLVDMQLGR
jgi:glycosyltransferase involved in cell wall biosynthesis